MFARMTTSRKPALFGIATCVALGCILTPHDATARKQPAPKPSYPIPLQPGIWPPEAPGWNLGASVPRGATGATAWAFIQNNIYDTRSALVDVDYLAIKATVNGKTVTLAIDDYGSGPGQLASVSGDWTPRADYTDPSLEIPGPIADSWSPTYFTTNTAKNLAYGMQIWNSQPGKVPRGTTKVWAEMRVRVNGSGLLCFGWDWYGTNGYLGNAGYSGFQTYLAAGATAAWQTVTLGN
jgi:hypothetical protein